MGYLPCVVIRYTAAYGPVDKDLNERGAFVAMSGTFPIETLRPTVEAFMAWFVTRGHMSRIRPQGRGLSGCLDFPGEQPNHEALKK